MRYVTLDFADDKGEDELRDVLTSLDEERGTGGNRMYYFAVPPSAIGTLVEDSRRGVMPRGSSVRSHYLWRGSRLPASARPSAPVLPRHPSVALRPGRSGS